MPPVHWPFEHVVPVVQEAPSSHAAPLLVGVPPVHTPAEHVVLAVHGLPSSHAAPSFPGADVQVLLSSSQAATKQPPGAGHCSGGPPLQAPSWQVSPSVQKSPSSQAKPLFFGMSLHPTLGTHAPTPQSVSRKMQFTGGPDRKRVV